MPGKPSDPIAAVAARVVADDPALRARMQRLVNAMLDDAEYTMRFGSPNERAALMRSVVPALLRSMQGADADATAAAQQAAYERMMRQMRGEEVEP